MAFAALFPFQIRFKITFHVLWSNVYPCIAALLLNFISWKSWERQTYRGNLFCVRTRTAGYLDLDCDFTELLLQSSDTVAVTSKRRGNSVSGTPWRLLNQSWTERGHFNTDIQLLLMRAVKCTDGKGIVDGTNFLWIEVPEIFALQCGFYFGLLCFCDSISQTAFSTRSDFSLRVIGISCEFQDNFQPEKSKGSKLSQWSACCCCPSSHEWSRSAWLPEIGHRSIPLCAVGYHKYTLNSLFLYLPRVWNGTRTRQARGGLKDGEVTPGWRCCC